MEKLASPKDVFQALYNHFLRLADSQLLSSGAAGATSQPSASAAFVEGDPEVNRLLCVQAMAAMYHHHAAAVGEAISRLAGLRLV